MVDGMEVERRAPFGDNPVVGPRGSKTQRRILEAALTVFAQHGYHDTSVEMITAAAGCSRPTFYQYFGGKKEVFRSLASYVGRAVVELTERLTPVTPDAAGRAALSAWMREFADLYDAYAPVFAGFSAAVRDDSGLAGASSLVSAGFGRTLRPHLRVEGEDVDADVMASIVVTMIVRANLLRLGSVGLVARARFVESLASLVQRVLLGPLPDLEREWSVEAGNGSAGTSSPSKSTTRRLRAQPPRLQTDAAERSFSPQGQRMRARILEAGVSVFPRLGFHETRVDDVVAAAGASHGSFYRYFASKDELFRVIATEAAGELIACIDAFPSGDDPAALRNWLDRWFDVYARHGGIIALWRETQFPDPALEELTRTVARAALGRLLAVLESRQEAGDPLVDAMAFLGLIETVPHHVHAFGYFAQPAAVDALVVIIRRGFLAEVRGGR